VSTDGKPDPYVDRTIGGCRIIQRIGRGAMAVVYKAHQISLDRIVALKLLDERSAADRDAMPRFFREARSAARLIHANVVQVYDVGIDQGVAFIVMEFVEGETLFDRLAREGRIPSPEALEVVRQAALALVRAEEFGIVHRDIKPANVMVSRRAEVKLADFGLAKMIGDTSVTGAGAACGLGTPYYMSPEQADGVQLDVRSDIYSLGATFYHLVTGRPPFQGPSTAAILIAHATEPLKPACDMERDVPRSVSDLIDKMLAKSPRDRYPSAGALLAAISGVKRLLVDGVADKPKPRTDLNPTVGMTDRRVYRRVPTDFVTEVRQVSADAEKLEAIRARVKNVSREGLYLQSDRVYPVGCVLQMRFRLGPHSPEMHALGVVRWTSAGPGKPGIGVHFMQIESAAAAELAQFVKTSADDLALRDLTRTPLHDALLKLHASAQGDVMKVGDIARTLDATHGLIRLVLRAFGAHGLIALRDDVVHFLVPESETLRQVIARHLTDGHR
jgi:tRNA A-37 threonylcarbamoyl transferase component Bud32